MENKCNYLTVNSKAFNVKTLLVGALVVLVLIIYLQCSYFAKYTLQGAPFCC